MQFLVSFLETIRNHPVVTSLATIFGVVVVGILKVAIKKFFDPWAEYLLTPIGRRIPRPPSARTTPIPVTIDPPPPPPFPGHDYIVDAIDGIRWRWRWRTYTEGEPSAEDLRAFCPADGCDCELTHREHGAAYVKETTLTCPSCGMLWNRQGYWTQVAAKAAVTIERNRRVGGRGDAGLRPYREEA